MRKPASILFLILFCSGISCRKSQHEPPFYTWKGRLFEGVSDKPLRNRDIYLQAYVYEGISLYPTITTIAQSVTDDNGNFNLHYRRINKKWPEKNTRDEGLWLESGPLPLTSHSFIVSHYPWNLNIKKDLAEVNHSRIIIDVNITTPDLPDSLYYEIAEPFENDFSRIFYFPNVNAYRKIFVVPVTERKFRLYHKSRIGASGFDNPPGLKLYFTYGISEEDFLLANSNQQNVPGTYNFISYQLRGFPLTDTIWVKL